jgi:hypothetical protein
MMRILLFVILIGLIGCEEESTPKEAPVSVAGLPTQPAALWIYPGGEGPTRTRLSFDPNGNAQFSGDFKGFNPVHWSYDSSAQVLTLRMNRIGKGDSIVFEDGVARGYAVGFNPATSALMLRLGTKTTQLWIDGYNFGRQPEPVQ